MNCNSNKNVSLVIIDTNVFLHSLITQFEKNPHLTELDKVEALRFNTMYVLSGAFLEGFIPSRQKIEVIFAMDSQPYWRTAKLMEIGCEYKGKRKTATRYHRSVQVNQLKNLLYNFLMEEYDLPLASMYMDRDDHNFPLVGFEADDIAAGLVLTQRENYDHIYVVTNDYDWLPFTTYGNVTWINLQEARPRIRDQIIAMRWLPGWQEILQSKERQTFIFDDILDLWNFKAYFGDKSDNIPGDKKDKSAGKYLQYISLFEPTKGFECWMQPDFDAKMQSSKTKAHHILSMDQIHEYNPGLPLCIKPLKSSTEL